MSLCKQLNHSARRDRQWTIIQTKHVTNKTTQIKTDFENSLWRYAHIPYISKESLHVYIEVFIGKHSMCETLITRARHLMNF